MNWALRIFAAAVDFFQFLIFVVFAALQFITPIGGAAAGGVGAARYCWSASEGIISGAYAAAKCALYGAGAGGVLSAFAIPIGMAIDVLLTMTFGAAIILGLAVAGKFHAQTVIASFLGETIPLVNWLPFWSIMVHRCIAQSEAGEESGGMFSTAFKFATGASTGGAASLAGAATGMARTRYQGAPQQAQKDQPVSRAPALLNRIPSDVRRPANDNTPQSYANAA